MRVCVGRVAIVCRTVCVLVSPVLALLPKGCASPVSFPLLVATYPRRSYLDSSCGGDLESDLSSVGSSIDEIQRAIGRCKSDILASDASSGLRAQLVAQLVRLRMRLLQLQQPDETDQQRTDGGGTPALRQLHGHQLRFQPFSRRRSYCDQCTGRILGFFHAWYLCQGCEYSVHAACIDGVKRPCAVERARTESPFYDLRICPERGLSFQKFLCAECQQPMKPAADPVIPECVITKVMAPDSVTPPVLCDYTGLYYCSRCHWADAAVIPARVIHDWDFVKYPVSRMSRQYLGVMSTKPVLDVEKLNSNLFNFIEDLRHVRKLREEIMVMKEYFVSCRAALDARVLLALGDRQYFIESSNLYSLRDLREVNTGELVTTLLPIHQRFMDHIRTQCQACRGKGHICGICSGSDILFPFDDQVMSCPQCGRVVHQHCYVKRDGQCPRCLRQQTVVKLTSPKPPFR